MSSKSKLDLLYKYGKLQGLTKIQVFNNYNSNKYSKLKRNDIKKNINSLIKKNNTVMGINNRMIDKRGRAAKNLLAEGYVIKNKKFIYPNQNINVNIIYSIAPLLEELDKLSNAPNSIIIETSQGDIIYQPFMSIDDFKRWFDNIYKADNYLYNAKIILNNNIRHGPAFDGEKNCVINCIETIYNTNNWKKPKNLNFNELYNMYDDGVFTNEYEDIADLCKRQIKINSLNDVWEYGQQYKKMKEKIIELDYNNNHTTITIKKEKIKIIDKFVDEYTLSNLLYGEELNKINDIMYIIENNKQIILTLTMDNIRYRLDIHNGINLKNIDNNNKLNFDNKIDIDRKYTFSSNSYCFDEFIKCLNKPIFPINKHNPNIDIINTISKTHLYYNEPTNDIELITLDLIKAYHNFEKLPTDCDNFIDCSDMDINNINIIINKYQGYGLVNFLNPIDDKIHEEWHAFSYIRDLNEFINFKVLQLIVSTRTTTLNKDKYMKKIKNILEYNPRALVSVFGKMVKTKSNNSKITTDELLGHKQISSNGNDSLYIINNIINKYTKYYYPHVAGYVYEYTNAKIMKMIIYLKSKNIKFYNIALDGINIAKSDLHLLDLDTSIWKVKNVSYYNNYKYFIKNKPGLKLNTFTKLYYIYENTKIFITAPAGYGKSYKLIKLYNQKGGGLILCPTLKKCRDYKGYECITYQKYLEVIKDINNKNKQWYRNVKNLFIDEVFLMSNEQLKKIEYILNKDSNIFLFGDKYQLGPINGKLVDTSEYELDISLNTNYRQQCPIFQGHLSKLRIHPCIENIKFITQKILIKDATQQNIKILTSTNRRRDYINYIGFINNPYQEINGWKINTPVIFNKAYDKLNIVNNEFGKVIDINNNIIYIELMEDKRIIPFHIEDTTNENIKFSYAITYHKVMGDTIDEYNTGIDTYRIFEKSMLYVGASRPKKLNQLYRLLD
jgi:hypothetical protein